MVDQKSQRARTLENPVMEGKDCGVPPGNALEGWKIACGIRNDGVYQKEDNVIDSGLGNGS